MATKMKYDPLDYVNTQELKYSKRITEKELRKAYTYFRDIARKRIQRLEEYGYTKGAQYQRMKALGLPVLKEIANRNQLAMYLQQVAFFVSTESSTVKGIKRIRKQKIDQFKEMGFEGINDKNLEDFLDFFETAKGKAVRGSGDTDIAQAWNTGRKQKATPKQIKEDFDKYVELANAKETAIEKPEETMTSAELKSELEQRK